MTQVFNSYARYYNLLYRDKNYAEEAKYVVKLIQKNATDASSILELGCGTGGHAEHLVRTGYTVHGIDMSETMLERANERKSHLPTDISARLSFANGDVRTIRTNQKYDVVISLFHVMSYQTTNDDIQSTFETAAAHLKPGGIFIFDFWYGPAVLTEKPEVRVKRLQDEHINVTRIAEPVVHVNENTVDVNYHVFIEDTKTTEFSQLRETHKMRYLFLPELKWLISPEKWNDFDTYGWLGFNALTEKDWSGLIIAKFR